MLMELGVGFRLKAISGQVSLESLVVREIDFLLLPDGAQPPPGVDLPVRFVPESIQFPGPRLGEATLALAEILHPEAFR